MPPKKVKKNKVAAEKPAAGKPRTLKPPPKPEQTKRKLGGRKEDASRHARIDPSAEPEKHESGQAGKNRWASAVAMASCGHRNSITSNANSQWTNAQALEQQKQFQHWDLALLVDSDHESQLAAKEEVEKLFVLLKKEGVQLSTALPMDDDAGWEGQVLALATATQKEFEEEAEMMGMSKPLILSPEIADRFNVGTDYARVTAPFTVAKRENFHKSPFVVRNRVLERGDGEDQDSSGLEYFSYVERQFLLEHMIEHRIRQLISQKQLSAQTKVTFFPLHEATGEEAKSFKGVHLREKLQKQWATATRWQRYRSVLKIWGNPADGLNEPLDDIRNYFGSQIGMYVAFLSFYTRWLVYPAIVGLFFQIWSFVYGFDNFGLVVCCAFICLWSALMIQFWIRKEASLAFSWFTHDPLSFDPKVRRDFYIEMDKYERKERPKTTVGRLMTGTSRKSDWTDEKIQADEMKAEDFTFPLWVRAKMVTVAFMFIVLFLSTAVIIFVYMYLINVVAAWTNCEYGVIIGSILHALMIIAVGSAYRILAVKLNDWENHRTEEDYENNFILKVFVFEFVNNFLSMIWIAFLSFRYCSRLEELGQLLPVVTADKICLLDGVEQCEDVFREKVIQELQIKLGTLFVTRLIVSNIIESKVIQRFVERFFEAKRQAAEEIEKAQEKLPRVEHVKFGVPASLAAKYARKNDSDDASKLEAPTQAPVGTPPLEKVSRDPDDEDEDQDEDEDENARKKKKVEEELEEVGRTKVTKAEREKGEQEKQKDARSRWAVINGVWAIVKKDTSGAEKGQVGGYGWWVCKGRAEATLPVYGDMEEAQTVDDYNEIVMQFSFVCLFGVAFPVVALLALISNLVEMLVDSKKLCFNSRRPFAQRASGIPRMWLKILKCVCAFGVVTNVVIVLTNSSLITDWLEIDTDGSSFWTAAFVFEHILVGLIIIFWQIVPDEPRAITKLQILSRRIQRAMLTSRLAEEMSVAAPGSPRNDPLLSNSIFNRPDVDDEEYYYIPSKQAQARAATGAAGARRKSST